MKDIGVIGSSDGPTSVIVSENLEEIAINDINAKLNEKTMAENLDAGIKIMGIGMVAVFGVLTILYLVVKIMGQFAKRKKENDKN